MAPHSFSPTRGGEEQTFLENEIVVPFVTAHKADLELFDLFGFAITDPTTHKIVIGTATDPNLSTAPGSGGAPSAAQRQVRWSAWETLVHEYIHTLEHPVFHSAGGANNRIMSEGFCTMFSEEVLNDQIPKAPKNAALRFAKCSTIGSLSPGSRQGSTQRTTSSIRLWRARSRP